MSSRELAELISKELIKNKYVKDVDIAGPGFINFFLKKEFWHQQLINFASSFDNYNYNVKPKKICVEYVSANPTGRLHIGHARGAVLGDAISSILSFKFSTPYNLPYTSKFCLTVSFFGSSI